MAASLAVACEPHLLPLLLLVLLLLGQYTLCYRHHNNNMTYEQGVAITIAADAATHDAPCFAKPLDNGKACPQPVQSAEKCGDIARELPEFWGSEVSAREQSAEDRPYGCWWQPSNGQLFFNIPPPGVEGSASCSSNTECLCCGAAKPASVSVPGIGAAALKGSIMTVKAVYPTQAYAGVTTTALLIGQVVPDDVYVWAERCDGSTPMVSLIVAHIPSAIAEDGMPATFELGEPGSYRLCRRTSGSGPFVEQRGVRLNVVIDPGARAACFPEMVETGLPFGTSCRRPIRSLMDCARVAALHPDVFVSGENVAQAQVAEDRPQGCWWGESNARLFFNLPPPGERPVPCSKQSKCICCANAMPTATVTTTRITGWSVAASLSADSSIGTRSPPQMAAEAAAASSRSYPCQVEVIIEGTCTQPVQSAQECTAAAEQLDVPGGVAVTSHSVDDQPAGCWWQPSNAWVFFNAPPQDAPKRQCTSNSRCLCCEAQASIPASCVADEFQDAAFVLPCMGGSGSTPLALSPGQARTLAVLPAGNVDAHFVLQGAEGLEARIAAEKADSCIVGQGCLHTDACANVTDFCIKHQSVSIHVGKVSAQRTIGIVGELREALVISTINTAAVVAVLEASYISGPHWPCPSHAAGCKLCGAYVGCVASEIAHCNGSSVVTCRAKGRTGVVTGIHPKSVSAGTTSLVALSGPAVSGDRVAWARRCGHTSPSSVQVVSEDLTVVAGLGLTGKYKLCYRPVHAKTYIEQTGIELTVLEPTSATIITGIGPRSITAGVPTTLYMQGTVADGDLVAWAPNCEGVTPTLRPRNGTDTLSTFTVHTAGTMRLCYRLRGGSDSVTQVGVTLRVLEPVSVAHNESCIPELVSSGKPFGETCMRPVQSAEACSAVTRQVLGADIPVAMQSAEDRPYGCWSQPGHAFFNVPPPENRPIVCSDPYKCICCMTRGVSQGSLRGPG